MVPQGKLKSAEEFYKYAVQLVDDYTPAHQGLAQLRLQSGNPREVCETAGAAMILRAFV